MSDTELRKAAREFLAAVETIDAQRMHEAVGALRAALAEPEPSRALALVHEQAEDEGLWFEAQTATEAYLQAALRELHAAVESAGSGK